MAEEYCQYKNLKAKLRLLEALLSKQQDSANTSWVNSQWDFYLTGLDHFLKKKETDCEAGRPGLVSCHADYVDALYMKKNRWKLVTIWIKRWATAVSFSPKNTSLVIHDASYKPDVASVFYVALIYVKDEQLDVSYILVILRLPYVYFGTLLLAFSPVPKYNFWTALFILSAETAFKKKKKVLSWQKNKK